MKHFHERNRYDQILITNAREVAQEGRFAMCIIERWAMVAGSPNGEDSAGRQRLGLMPTEDVVGRAFDIASRTFKMLEQRGLIEDVPAPKDEQ